MLKILIKKQLTSLLSGILTNRRIGKRRSKVAFIGYAALMIVCGILTMVSFGMMLSVNALTLLCIDPSLVNGAQQDGTGAVVFVKFYDILSSTGSFSIWTGNIGQFPLIDQMCSLYFAVAGIFTCALGLVGGMFSTYIILYCARDNESLLAMPIKPSAILLSRMLSVYMLILLYTSIVFIPALVIFFIFAGFSILVLLKALAMYIMLTLLLLALSCVLGWLLGVVAAKLGGRRTVSIISIFVAIGSYMFFYFGRQKLMDSLASSPFAFDENLKKYVYPLYAYGHGSVAAGLEFVLFCLIAIAGAALAIYLLSRSFVSLITTKKSGRKKVYVEKTAKTRSVFGALFRRDLRLFLTTPAYLLNTGLISLLLVVAAVALLFNYNHLRDLSSEASRILGRHFLQLIIIPAIGMATSTIFISASSISIEGRMLWIIQTLPVNGNQVVLSKILLHMLFAGVPSFLLALSLSIALGFSFAVSAAVTISSLLFTLFICCLGLTLELRNPKLEWIDENAAVKQNSHAIFCWLAGGAVAVTMGGLALIMYFKVRVNGDLLFVLQASTTVCLAALFTRLAFRQWPRLQK